MNGRVGRYLSMEMVVLLAVVERWKKKLFGHDQNLCPLNWLDRRTARWRLAPGGWPAHRQLQGCAHTGGESRIPSGPLWMYFFRGYHGKTQEVVNLSTVWSQRSTEWRCWILHNPNGQRSSRKMLHFQVLQRKAKFGGGLELGMAFPP